MSGQQHAVEGTLPLRFYKLCSSPNEVEKGLKFSMHFLLNASFQQKLATFSLSLCVTKILFVHELQYHLFDVVILWAGTIRNVFS